MKLIDLCLDRLNRTRLFEMAFERHVAKQKVTDLSPTIFEHLVKLFVFKLPDTRSHWIKELNNFFGQIDKIYLKPNKRKLPYEEIYNWLIFDSAPHYSPEYLKFEVFKMLQRDYKGVGVYDFNPEHLLNIILGIIQKVSLDISKNTFVSIENYLPHK